MVCKTINRLFPLLILTVSLFACEKEFDAPPGRTVPVGDIMTVAELRAMYTGVNVKFTEDKTIYAVVTSDERTGNFYREAYVQDPTGAIYLRFTNSGGLYQGDSVRINLNGAILTEFNGQLQVDSLDVDENIVKQATNVAVNPTVITDVSQITDAFESHLLKLEGVQFAAAELGQTYADGNNLTSANRMLEDCFGNQIIVRTSGFANFANDSIPTGNGTFIGILGEYRGDLQLYIRNTEEVKLDGARCSGCPAYTTISEDFSGVFAGDPVSLACWSNIVTKGTEAWYGGSFSGNFFAEMESYQSSDPENETWLISPPVAYAGTDVLSFESSMAYWDHDALEVFVSTDFDGANVNAATWTAVSCTLAGENDNYFDWIPSGSISLASYLPSGYAGNYFIAFKYSGNAASLDSKYRIDNVQISK